MVEKDWVYDLLASRNLKHDQIRVQVLGREPSPTLREAYAIVQQEESQRHAMVHSVGQDHSTLAVVHTILDSKPIQPKFGGKGSSIDQDLLKCDYCRKERHDKEHCWKLNGCPTRRRRGGRVGTVCSQLHVSKTASGLSSDSRALSQDEVLALRRLVTRLDTSTPLASSSTSSSHFAYIGTLC